MNRDGIFSVALAVPDLSRGLPVRKYGALCCPDFPPRPESNQDRAIRQLALQKYEITGIGSSLMNVLAGKLEFKLVGNVCHLPDHLLNQTFAGVLGNTRSDYLEEAIFQNKAAVIKGSVPFKQIP